MDTVQRYHDIGPIRINLHSLITSIRTHAIDWKNTLGGILAEKTLENMKGLREHISVSFVVIYVYTCIVGINYV